MRDPLSPEALALQEAEANLRNWLGTGGVFGESAEQFIVRHRDAVLSAERARLAQLTPEAVIEAAAQAICEARYRGHAIWGDLPDYDREVYRQGVRAALPIILAPEIAKREAAEKALSQCEIDHDAMHNRAFAAEAERDRLKAALEKYGRHSAACASRRPYTVGSQPWSCDCGFAALSGRDTVK